MGIRSETVLEALTKEATALFTKREFDSDARWQGGAQCCSQQEHGAGWELCSSVTRSTAGHSSSAHKHEVLRCGHTHPLNFTENTAQLFTNSSKHLLSYF
jgi:hypothetical protein